MSAGLCTVAFSNEARFPDVVDAIIPLVTSIAGSHLVLPNVLKSDENLLRKYPKHALALLWAVLPEDATAWPHGTADALEQIGISDNTLVNDERLTELRRRLSSK